MYPFPYSTLLALFSRCTQDCQDESEGDGMKRERSLLMLASLATNALDEVYGMSKVRAQLSFVLPRLFRYSSIRRGSASCHFRFFFS